jgi:hypothetical protein
MAEIQEILSVLEDIKRQVADIEERIVVGGAQVSVPEGLSDISENLGLIKSGEFRSGKGIPGRGFTGVRMGWPGFVYTGETYNVVGVDNDGLQFGLRASDGKAVFGAGAVILDATGIALDQGTANVNTIKWVDGVGTFVGQVYVTGQSSDGVGGYYSIAADAGEYSELILRAISGVDRYSYLRVEGRGDVGIGGGVKFRFLTTLDSDGSPITLVDLEETEAAFGIPIKIKEAAAAAADSTGYGQLWVKNTTPCELWFTDDEGALTKIA